MVGQSFYREVGIEKLCPSPEPYQINHHSTISLSLRPDELRLPLIIDESDGTDHQVKVPTTARSLNFTSRKNSNKRKLSTADVVTLHSPTTSAHSEAKNTKKISSNFSEVCSRGGWLLVLLLCQSVSSSILSHYRKIILVHPNILAFLTMLVGTGGNASSQSTCIVLEKMAKRELRTRGSIVRVFAQQSAVGLQLALFLAVAAFFRATVTKSVELGEVLSVAISTLLITAIGVVLGTGAPLVLKSLRLDPVLASTAAVSVLVDVLGSLITIVVTSLVYTAMPDTSSSSS